MAMEAATTPAEALRIAHGKNAKISQQEVTMFQVQAVIALEAMGDPAAVDTLHALQQSGQGRTRIAAARAILKLLRSQRPAALPAPESQTNPQAGADEPPASQPVVMPALHTSGGKD
jgi:HEAT repeat protein